MESRLQKYRRLRLELHDKNFRRAFVFWVILALLFAYFQFDRSRTIIANASEGEFVFKPYEKGNHELFVYHSPNEMNLRTSPNFKFNADNVATTLKHGDIFFVSNFKNNEAIKRIDNYPKDNVTRYRFKQINKFVEGKLQSELVGLISEEYYVMKEKDTFHDVQPYQSRGYLFLRSSTLLSWIWTELKENGWNGCDNIRIGNFSYTKGGFYGTTLKHNVTLHDMKGNVIGELPKGSRIFGNWELPFVTGHNRPDLIRIIGYTENGSHEYVRKVGTFFIEGYMNGKKTIETLLN
ncbi:hypothetical protein FZC76_07775 [Sutcliffiella horikoshii]|uniref:Uncharacterized protein n=1 Tax=Sutcliffiella horikoshii TaxID=79883 RepID=A0A5D4T2H0_9BACI|nr:hypothetical protein [Sutcliffiella horikoshii]TYS68828.1 hypothetical protein FZC76_07775 [Sutcliffiella horikoshii]